MTQVGGSRGALYASPDGRLVLFSVRQASLADNSVRLSWWIAPANGDTPYRIADGGEPVPVILEDGRPSGSTIEPRATWSPSGNEFAFILRIDGVDHLAVTDLMAHTTTTIPLSPGNVIDFRWRGSDAIDAKVLPPQQANAHDRENGYLFDERFAPSASLIPLRETLVPVLPILVRWRRGASIARIPTFAEDPAPFPTNARLPTVSPSSALAWTEPLSADRSGHFASTRVVQKAPGGSPYPCTDDTCTGAIEQLFWSADGRELFFVKREGIAGAERALYLWRGEGDKPRLVLRTTDMLQACVGVSAGVACIRQNPIQPRRLVLIDAHDNTVHVLFDPNPSFARAAFGRVERISISDEFGNLSFAHLVYPVGYRGGIRYPLVIVQYRWQGFLLGGIGGEYPIHLFAQKGFFVLEIDRPEDRDLGSRVDADALQSAYEHDAYVRRMSYSALQTYVRFLEERGLVDPDRIGLTGLSDGASSLYYALIQHMHVAAAIASTPPSDPFDYYLASDWNRDFITRNYGASDPLTISTDHWRAISPYYSANQIHVPLLMNLAQSEYLRALPFYVRARDAKEPVEMYVFMNEHHIKTQPQHIAAIYRRNLAWFDFWLNHNDTPDGVDTEALVRWRHMRAASDGDASGVSSSRHHSRQ